jgi:predicted SnoaL-like aldol condensation-catalyzing enzyme
MMRERNPQTHVDVHRVFVDGDHVIIHAHVVSSPEERGSAHVAFSGSTAAT